MLAIFFIFTLKCFDSEARVFCQDSNANPWMPLGHSCPLMCQNIMSAIEKLKLMDYEKILQKNMVNGETYGLKSISSLQPDETRSNFRRDLNSGQNMESENVTARRVFEKIIHDKIAVNELKKELKTFVKCWMPFDKRRKSSLMKKMNKGCRKMQDEEFLALVTRILNTHAHSQYQFTEEMTGILLEKILGKNMDLRHGVYDMNKVFEYLNEAITTHESHKTGHESISLKSKNCLLLYVPGCFCRPGFVENSGQCVRPFDCFTDPSLAEYLNRIVIY